MFYPPLKSLHLRLTSICNMSCKYCYANAKKEECHENVYSEDLIDQVISESLNLNLEKLTLIGGEPTISGFFEYTLKKIFKETVDIEVDIETNGLLILKYYDVLRKNRDRVNVAISFDNKSIRSESKYNEIKSILEKLKGESDWVYVQSILTNDSIKNREVLDNIDFVNSLNLGHRIFPGPNKMGRGVRSDYLKWSNTIKVIKYCQEKKYKRVRFELPDYMKKRTPKSCGWKNFRCEIMPNGNVTPCGPIAFNNPEFIGGNVLKDSLSKIWLKSDFFKWIRNLKQKDFEGKCNNCKYWLGCYGKCRSFAWSWGNNFFSEYPHCREFDNSTINCIYDAITPDTRY